MAKVINVIDLDRFGHHEHIITNGSNKPSASCDIGMMGCQMDLVYGDPVEVESVESTWWDSAYKYRYKMDIYATVSGVSVPSGTTIMAYVDVDTLYAQSKCLVNYNDIRVVKYSAGWAEIARDYLKVASHPSIITTSSKFLFKTNVAIPIRDESYYLYYGNPNADVPASGVVSTWDYQDDFGDASIGADWTTSGTGNFSETGGYLQIQHTSVTYQTNGGWDDCPVIYKAVSNEEILLETKVTFENGSNEQGGIFVSDGTRQNAIMFGLRDTSGTLYVQGSYVTWGKLVDSGTLTGAINYYYRLLITRGGISAYYSTNGTTWTLYGAWNFDWKIKWVGLYMRNTSSTNSNYQRFEYFYMTNRNFACGIDEEAPQYGRRMRGRKGFKNGSLVPFNQF